MRGRGPRIKAWLIPFSILCSKMSGNASNPDNIGPNNCKRQGQSQSPRSTAASSETRGTVQGEFAEPTYRRHQEKAGNEGTTSVHKTFPQQHQQHHQHSPSLTLSCRGLEQQKPQERIFAYAGQIGNPKSIKHIPPAVLPTNQQERSEPIQIIYARPTEELLQKRQAANFSLPFYIYGESYPQLNRHPTETNWGWGDSRYVDVPFSSEFVKIRIEYNQRQTVPRWSIIEESLGRLSSGHFDATSLKESMKNAIKTYNATLAEGCNFDILDNPELSGILKEILSFIIERCLELPRLLATPLPRLQRGQSHTIYLTRQLCCSLLANAFFCTIPHNSSPNPKVLPHFHFLRLFHDDQEGADQARVKVEKLKCVLEYFRQVSEAVKRDNKAELESIISFERRSISQKASWSKSNRRLCHLAVNLEDTIEDAEGAVQADFANKYIGGGILSRGMVQEEIRFACCPDLIVSRLITEVLGNDEVLVITGAKFFNDYTGYRTSFRQKKINKPKPLSRDRLGREMVQVVAMDALKFNRGSESDQYEKHYMDRELHKAFVAFYKGHDSDEARIATGNWGCGAFNGDPQFKLLLQWIAASEAGREIMVFYTLGDPTFSGKIQEIVRILENKTVSNVYKLLQDYHRKRGRMSVFEFVKQNV